MSAAYAPLREDELSRDPMGADVPGARFGRCLRWTCGILVVIVILAVIVAAAEGMFNAKRHSKPRPANGEVVEPNTKERFPMSIHENQRIVGLTLWTHEREGVKGARAEVAVVGLYVNRDSGEKRLKRFKSRDAQDNYDQDLENALVAPGMTETMRFRMVNTPSNRGQFVREWVEDLESYVSDACGGNEDLVKEQLDAFKDALEKRLELRRGVEFSLERRSSDDALFIYVEENRAKRRWRPWVADEDALDDADVYADDLESRALRGAAARAEDGDKPEKARVGTSSCLSRALFRERLNVHKNGLTNLLDEFFKR